MLRGSRTCALAARSAVLSIVSATLIVSFAREGRRGQSPSSLQSPAGVLWMISLLYYEIPWYCVILLRVHDTVFAKYCAHFPRCHRTLRYDGYVCCGPSYVCDAMCRRARCGHYFTLHPASILPAARTHVASTSIDAIPMIALCRWWCVRFVHPCSPLVLRFTGPPLWSRHLRFPPGTGGQTAGPPR